MAYAILIFLSMFHAGETFEAHIQSNIQLLKMHMEVLWDDN